MTAIVFLDRCTFAPEVALRKPAFEHQWSEYDRTASGEIVSRLQGARVAITNKVPLRAETLEQLPDLAMISVAATGCDVIDVPACKARGIVVSNVRGYAVNTVPEHTMALIFALRRAVVGYRQDVIDGRWQKAAQFCFHTHAMRDLRSSRLCIVGRGSLGGAVGAMAEALGMEVIYAGRRGVEAPPAPYVPFDEALVRSDIVALHCPLTPETKELISERELRLMAARRPLLINTSRGGLINEADVVRALDEGWIAGVGLDVLSTEPPKPGNPLLGVLARPNVIVTPHVAWASLEAQAACWEQTVGNVESFVGGAPTNVVGQP